jgi:hypothetical protein
MTSPRPIPLPPGPRVYLVTLADGRRLPLGSYVASWRRIRDADPEDRFRGAPSDWFGLDYSAAEILSEFRAAMHARINRHVPGYGRGRKWSSDWQIEAARTARAVNTPRLVVRWIPSDLRDRLVHRITAD